MMGGDEWAEAADVAERLGLGESTPGTPSLDPKAVSEPVSDDSDDDGHKEGHTDEEGGEPKKKPTGRPPGTRSRPYSVLVAEAVAKACYKRLRDEPEFLETLKQHEFVQLLKVFSPQIRQLAADFEPHTDARVFRVEFDGAVGELKPLPPGTVIEELEGAAESPPASLEERAALPAPVSALRAAAAEQAVLKAEDDLEAEGRRRAEDRAARMLHDDAGWRLG